MEQKHLEDNSYELFCETEIFIMIFMALNIVLENYFEDVLSLVDFSSDICDEILGCWFLLFNIFFNGLFKLNRHLLFMDFGALHKYLYIIPFSNFKFQNKSNSITSHQLDSEFF